MEASVGACGEMVGGPSVDTLTNVSLKGPMPTSFTLAILRSYLRKGGRRIGEEEERRGRPEDRWKMSLGVKDGS